uniref:Serpin domain-containing protein n=1 Tax=Schistocephalus solidus TaxID=70667 RepID=A0A0X3NMS9_SCHSO
MMSTEGLKSFASDLYASLVSEGQGCSKNIFFSPASIYSAFSILLAGTAGETEKEIEKALHVTHEKDQTKLHKSIAKDLANLTGSTPETKVCMANKIFLDKGFPIKSAYSSLVSGCYSATPEGLTFSDSETSRAHINQWVKDKTEQKIGELFPANSINDQTKMVIANAVYFKGLWTLPFEKSNTKDGKFTLPDLRKKDVKLMYKNIKKANFCDFEDMEAKAVCLSFKESSLSMFILLPNQENGLPQLLKKLFTVGPTPDGCGDKRYLDMFLSSMYYYTQEVNLYLPRFKIGEDDPSINLVDYMRKLGVSKIFNHSVADFSGLTDVRNLCVSSVLHRAVLEVDEEGAQAAAATGMGIMLMCLPPPPVDFKVTHPFVIAIADNEGTPLFLGHVSEPK